MHKESKASGCGCGGLSRRELLRVAGTSAGAILLTTALPGCSNPTGSPPGGPVSAMKVTDYKVDSLQVLSSNVAVGRDSKGLYAMSAICTHAGCVLEDNAGTIAAGLYCPCHGSSFDGDGMVIHGPARSPLQHYQVSVAADGSITVDGSKAVAADVRLPTG
jgi:cytochrome b6-f complex iron-sulfur subunit